jgi:tryptophan synthase alpha chain
VSRLYDALAGGGKLVAFIVAGDPDMESSYGMACSVIEAGADVLELGLPFSDPIADGPTIQEAGKRALDAGMNTDRYFRLAERVSRAYDTPLVCLTYYNIILQYGLDRFARCCASSAIEGVIVPDLPLEEAGPLTERLDDAGVDFIFIVAETTTDGRLDEIAERAGGFVYVTAVLGTTGAREGLSPGLRRLIRRVKSRVSIPVAVGFGISTPEHVRKVHEYGAEAAIVGSAIVKLTPKGRDTVKRLVKRLKTAV